MHVLCRRILAFDVLNTLIDHDWPSIILLYAGSLVCINTCLPAFNWNVMSSATYVTPELLINPFIPAAIMEALAACRMKASVSTV